MFRRRSQDTLPTATYSAYNGSSSRGVTDGSGRAIRMDSPIVRAWKNSSGWTKGSYYSIVFNVFLMVWGYMQLRRGSASIWLTCHAVECTLQITPPGSIGSTKIQFSRKQIVRSEAIKVDKQHNFVRLDTGPLKHHYGNQGRKQKKKYPNGPDVDGLYDSYTLVLRPPIHDDAPDDETRPYEADLAPIDKWTYAEEGTDNRILPMRTFNLGQTKRRTRTMTSKVDSYMQKRRHQLIIKENASLSIQGVLAVVFGMFLLLLTFLIGQFFEEPPKHKTGGPGARRTKPNLTKMNRQNIGKFH